MSTFDARVTELLARPSLEGLSYALRHPEVWPSDYAKTGWYFVHCSRCAMGLAKSLWPDDIKRAAAECIAHCFQIGCEDAEKLFDRATAYHRIPAFTQPYHVADAIDAYLAARHAD